MRDWGVAAAIFAASLAAAAPWWRAYDVSGQSALLVAACAFPVVAVAVFARLGEPPLRTYAASAAGFVVLLLSSSGFDVVAVARGLGQGPDRLITETLPLSGPRATLAPALLLTWLCSAATAEMVIRAPEEGSAAPTRARSAALADLALTVPLACFVLAYAVSAGAPGGTVWSGPFLLLALAAVAAGRHFPASRSGTDAVADPVAGGPEGEPGLVSGGGAGASGTFGASPAPSVIGRRRLWTAAAATALLAVLLGLVVPSLPGFAGRPASLNKPVPVAQPVVADPVGEMASFREDPPGGHREVVMQLHTSGPTSGYLAMGILDAFDGSHWTFDSTFEPTGGRVPQAAAGETPLIGSGLVTVDEDILSQAPVALLPVPDRAVEVRGVPVAADPVTGMVVPQGPVRLPARVQVVSDAPVSRLDQVPKADGIGSPPGLVSGVASADLGLPPDSAPAMGAALRFVATLTGVRPSATVGFLQQLLAALRSQEKWLNPRLAPASGATGGTAGTGTGTGAVTQPAGHVGGTSLSEVINAVTVDRSATPEQFSTFFALVARYLGVPARLVTGFRFVAGPTGPAVAGGSYRVGSDQAWSWVEIPVSGMGWVVADATPAMATGVASPPPEQVQAPPTTLAPPKANAVPRSQASGGHAVARPVKSRHHRRAGLPAWLVAVAIIAGAAVAGGAAGPGLAYARRRYRRSARRSQDPAFLAAGAWLEMIDSLERSGMRVSAEATSAEVAADAGGHFGAGVAPLVLEVGALADRALYSPGSPPDGASASDAWRRQREVDRLVWSSLDRRQKLRATVSVGSAPRRPG